MTVLCKSVLYRYKIKGVKLLCAYLGATPLMNSGGLETKLHAFLASVLPAGESFSFAIHAAVSWWRESPVADCVNL